MSNNKSKLDYMFGGFDQEAESEEDEEMPVV